MIWHIKCRISIKSYIRNSVGSFYPKKVPFNNGLWSLNQTRQTKKAGVKMWSKCRWPAKVITLLKWQCCIIYVKCLRNVGVTGGCTLDMDCSDSGRDGGLNVIARATARKVRWNKGQPQHQTPPKDGDGKSNDKSSCTAATGPKSLFSLLVFF